MNFDLKIRHTTKYKNNSRYSSKIKHYSHIELCRNLENECFEMPNASYTNRWATCKKNRTK